MVLHRPVELARVIGHVVFTGFQLASCPHVRAVDWKPATEDSSGSGEGVDSSASSHRL